MKLSYVTLTGADETVDPQDLAKISEKYPFVEWAILFSQSKAGVPRYPSWDWVERLLEVQETSKMNLAAHLCGKWVDDIFETGEITFLRDNACSKAFRRIQLNMNGDRLRKALDSLSFVLAVEKANHLIILGGNYDSVDVDEAFFYDYMINPLFDASGGRGIEAKVWSRPFNSLMTPGFAGGLGPDNVVDEVKRIAEVAGDIAWIDMETKLRTKSGSVDRFDLNKCEQVLEAMKPWAV